jgi:hypothetical protein
VAAKFRQLRQVRHMRNELSRDCAPDPYLRTMPRADSAGPPIPYWFADQKAIEAGEVLSCVPRRRLAQYAFSDGIRTRVVQATHGDASGVRGAAWLWPIKKT